MTLGDLLEICKAYRNLGDAIADQLNAVAVDEGMMDEQNPNALELALDRFIEPLSTTLEELVENSGGDEEQLAELLTEAKCMAQQISEHLGMQRRIAPRFSHFAEG
jgi:hypothetical protein